MNSKSSVVVFKNVTDFKYFPIKSVSPIHVAGDADVENFETMDKDTQFASLKFSGQGNATIASFKYLTTQQFGKLDLSYRPTQELLTPFHLCYTKQIKKFNLSMVPGKRGIIKEVQAWYDGAKSSENIKKSIVEFQTFLLKNGLAANAIFAK